MFGDWICTNHHQPCHCSMDLFKAVWGNHVFSFKTWVVQLFFVPAGWELKAFCWSFHELIYIPEMLNLLCFLLVLSNSKLYSQVWCWWGPKRITRNLKKKLHLPWLVCNVLIIQGFFSKNEKVHRSRLEVHRISLLIKVNKPAKPLLTMANQHFFGAVNRAQIDLSRWGLHLHSCYQFLRPGPGSNMVTSFLGDYSIGNWVNYKVVPPR